MFLKDVAQSLPNVWNILKRSVEDMSSGEPPKYLTMSVVSVVILSTCLTTSSAFASVASLVCSMNTFRDCLESGRDDSCFAR